MNEQSEDQLRWQLQGLRREIEPANDLWPGIATRLSRPPGKVQRPSDEADEQDARGRRGWRGLAPLALAASLLLAIGFVWQLDPGAPAPGEAMIPQQAVAMVQEYETAVGLVEQAPLHPEMRPVLHDLDRSAAQILSAIHDHPESRFLLDQLRRTYSRRLELTQRAVIS